MSAGVRNLRAMFENQPATSTSESRGRSPVDSAAADGAVRTTSKVRASFVPVAPDLGVAKGTPTNSVAAHRRESFSVAQDNVDELADIKRAVTQEREERRQSIAVAEAVPEQAVASRESSAPAPPFRDPPDGDMSNLGAIMKGSDFPGAVEEPGATPVDEAPAPLSTDTAPPAPEPVDTPAADTKAIDTPPVDTSVAETPIADTPIADTPNADASAVDTPVSDASLAETPADNPDKPATGAQEEATLKPADLTDAAAVTGGEALPAPAQDLHTSTPKAAESKPKPNGAPAVKPKADVKKPAPISTPKASASKTAPLKSPLKSPVSKPTTKRPTTPKLTSTAPAPKPKSSPVAKPVSKPAAPKEPKALREPPKAPVHKTSRSSLRQSSGSAGAAPTASAAAKTKPVAPASAPESKKPAAVTSKPAAPSAAANAPKKPLSKSPTRPAALSSRLTKPTAASAAKLGEEKPVRKPSTTTRPSVPSKPAPAAKPSRPSVAPGTTTTKRPESRVSAAAPNEGFLARMMRPTTASASKSHEKPTSPPHKAPAKSVLQKGKTKVAEVATKAKAAVTSDHDDHTAKPSSPIESVNDSTTANSTEAAEADLKEIPETDVKEIPETDVKEIPEADVEETPEADVEETPEADVKEIPETDVKEIPEVRAASPVEEVKPSASASVEGTVH